LETPSFPGLECEPRVDEVQTLAVVNCPTSPSLELSATADPSGNRVGGNEHTDGLLVPIKVPLNWVPETVPLTRLER